jgi:hypothetical protein
MLRVFCYPSATQERGAMFQPFGAKHLSEIDRSDLDALINNQVPEGLFVEYKGEWVSTKVARAVASFANSQGGGWLIVGMDADKLFPTNLAGLQDAGDLEERVVSTIRSSISGHSMGKNRWEARP